MRSSLVVGALIFSLSPAFGQHSHTMVNANEVQWKDGPASLPGTQISVLYGDMSKEGMFVARLKFPANYKVPAHTHPVDEIVTVISGEFRLAMGKEFDESKLKPYTAGALIAMPPGTEHFVQTKQDTVIQISTKGPWAIKFVNPNEKGSLTQ